MNSPEEPGFDEAALTSEIEMATRRVLDRVVNQEQPHDPVLLNAYGEAQLKRLNDVEERARLREQSMTDELTGLANLRSIKTTFASYQDSIKNDRTVDLNRRDEDQPVAKIVGSSFVHVDADKFKNINDTYGHAGGDKILQLIASVFRENLRAGDVAARTGGDEFGLILFRVTPEQANARLETVRSELVRQSQELGMPASVSIGIGTIRPGETYEETKARVDDLLYSAKEAGRNAIVSESVESPQRAA